MSEFFMLSNTKINGATIWVDKEIEKGKQDIYAVGIRAPNDKATFIECRNKQDAQTLYAAICRHAQVII